jgi:hypothetical protein
MNKENVLPALVMNLSVCLIVVATTTGSIKYLFWFFIIFHVYYILNIFKYRRGNNE